MHSKLRKYRGNSAKAMLVRGHVWKNLRKASKTTHAAITVLVVAGDAICLARRPPPRNSFPAQQSQLDLQRPQAPNPNPDLYSATTLYGVFQADSESKNVILTTASSHCVDGIQITNLGSHEDFSSKSFPFPRFSSCIKSIVPKPPGEVFCVVETS
jgi:hypothetical protein